jgi:hypothetical protein
MQAANLYVRTPLGRTQAFDAASKLSHPLRTLLLAIDGKTPTNVLLSQLAQPENLTSLLLELEKLDLIVERKNPPLEKPNLPVGEGTRARLPIDSLLWQEAGGSSEPSNGYEWLRKIDAKNG